MVRQAPFWSQLTNSDKVDVSRSPCRRQRAGNSSVPASACGEGQGGAMKQNRCECSPSPTLPRARGREHTELAARGTDSRQPALEIGVHERIVVEVRIG